MSLWDWLSSGPNGAYQPLQHCMSGDNVWAGLFGSLSLTLFAAYTLIAWAYFRAGGSLASERGSTRDRLLRGMVAIFMLCGFVHLSRPAGLLPHPPYKLFVIALGALNVVAWGVLIRSRFDLSALASASTEERLANVWSMAGVGVTFVDAESNRFVGVNDRFVDLVGYSRDELEQLTFVDITHPEDAAGDLRLWGEVVRGERSGFSIRKRYVTKEGKVVYADLTVILVHGPDGDHSLSLIRDVTEEAEKVQSAVREAFDLRSEVSYERQASAVASAESRMRTAAFQAQRLECALQAAA